MANINISFSPGPDGINYATIIAEGEPGEVDAMIEAADKLWKHYPVLKPKLETKSTFPTGR